MISAKTKILFLCLVLFAGAKPIKAQEQLNSDLFFCHENIEIKSLWPVGKGRFLANIRQKVERGSFTKNSYFLFNRKHLVVDTVDNVMPFMLTVNMENENTISFISEYDSRKYDISEDEFQLVQQDKGTDFLSVFNRTDKDHIYMIGSFNGLKFGYFSKAKNRTLKRSKKNIPRYFYIDANDKQVWINSGTEDVVGDQWESFLEKPIFALGDVNLYKDELYINIPMVGRCYIFNTKTLKTKTVLLPQEGAESWFLTVDKAKGTHYLIGHLKDESFDIYHIDLKNNKRTLLANFEGYMDMVYNEQALCRKKMTEGKKEFYCYYLSSLYK